MAKKKTLDEIIVECPSRNCTSFYANLSDDAFCGYTAAMIVRNNLNLMEMPEQIYKRVCELFKEGKL